MTKKTIIFILFILSILAGVAQAQLSITYSSGGKQYFTMKIADDWRVNVGSESDPSRLSEDRKGPTRLVSAMPNKGCHYGLVCGCPSIWKKFKMRRSTWTPSHLIYSLM